jgi:hypothetical protein
MSLSEPVIITIICCFTFILTFITILRLCYRSKCTNVEIKRGDTSLHYDMAISKEMKDVNLESPKGANAV